MCSGGVRFWSYLWGSGVTDNPYQRQWLFFFSLAFNWDSFCTSLNFSGISDKCPLAQRCKHWLLGNTLFQVPVQEAVAACLLEGAVGGRWDAGSGLTSTWNGQCQQSMRFPSPAFSCLNVGHPGLGLGRPEEVSGACMYPCWYPLTCDICVNAAACELCATKDEIPLPTQRCPMPPEML